MGHIQMASIEMKGFIKQLTSNNLSIREQQNIIKSAYVSIYETSKRLIDGTGDIMKFISSNFVTYDSSPLKLTRKELTSFRESNKGILTLVRNKVAAHRDTDICEQIATMEGLHLSDLVSLIVEYGNIINNLGKVVSPIKTLGINRLEATK
jgi:phage-related minor tail protein